jgi:Disulphide bond corrector protein DsbC
MLTSLAPFALLAAAVLGAVRPTGPALPAGGAGSQLKAFAESGESLVKTEVIRLGTTIEAGKPFQVGIRYTIAPKWHLYWRNPGDSGNAPTVEWTLPDGFVAGALEFPRPIVIEHPGEVTIGYEGDLVLRTTITPPADRPVHSEIAVSAKLEWLVCSNKCLMGRRTLEVVLPREGAPVAPISGEIPESLERLGLAAELSGNTLIIRSSKTATIEAGSFVRFIPDATPGVTYGATVPPPAVMGDGELSLVIPLTIKPQNALGEPLRAAGLVTLTTPTGRPSGCAEISLPVAAQAADPVAPPAKKPHQSS